MEAVLILNNFHTYSTILKKIKTEICPIDHVPYTNRQTTWVKPALVVEVKFNEWTERKIMRAPIFLKFKKDKNPQECIIEENYQPSLLDDTIISFEKKNSEIDKTDSSIEIKNIKYKDNFNSDGNVGSANTS